MTDEEQARDHSLRTALHDSTDNLFHVWRYCRVGQVHAITRQGRASPDKDSVTLAGLACAWCPYHNTTHAHSALVVEITRAGCTLHCKHAARHHVAIKTPLYTHLLPNLFARSASTLLFLDNTRWGLRAPRQDFGISILNNFLPKRGVKRPHDQML